MQTKLSKLQREILIHLYHNRKTIIELEPWRSSSSKKIEGKYHQRKQLFIDIAEKHNKLIKRIKGRGVFRIHLSYFPTLKNSVVSLIKRGLIKGWGWLYDDISEKMEFKETEWFARIEYLQLTQEGIETAEELLKNCQKSKEKG